MYWGTKMNELQQPNEPEFQMNAVDGVWVLQLHFKKAGDTLQTHSHTYNHISLLTNGSVRIVVGEEQTVYTAPQMIYIDKDTNHKIVALEDNTISYCIHALRSEEGDLIEGLSIPAGVKVGSIVKRPEGSTDLFTQEIERTMKWRQ